MKLKDNEMICDRCEGTGYEPTNDMYWPKQHCKKCRGNKKVDWLENIVGVRKTEEKEHNSQIDLGNYVASYYKWRTVNGITE